MTTIAKINYQRKQAGLPLIRFDLRKLNPDDVQDLRDAYAAMYEISDIAVGDSRGYIALARGHGYDQDLCHRDSRIFLTWHRSYVYAFEKALNSALQWKRGDQELELTLPFWDWTVFDESIDAPNGLPAILNEASYTDPQGNQVANPLASAWSLYRSVSQGLSGSDAFTQRFPDALRGTIPILKDDVDRYLDNPNFMSFSNDFNGGAHGTVHVVVGGQSSASPLPGNSGDMSAVVSAAYDPIFWLHHCMVDKVWYDWQVLNPNANIPQHVLETPVYGGLPGSHYIDAEQSLQYIYSSDSVESAQEEAGTLLDDSISGGDIDGADTGESDSSESEPVSKIINTGTVKGPFSRAQLDFHQLRPPKSSYEIRAYIGEPPAKDDVHFGDQAYAGRLTLFGHGHCHGAPDHCNPDKVVRDKYDIRPKHYLRYQSTQYAMDVTRGLRRYMDGRDEVDNVTFYLVTLDGAGQVVDNSEVKYRGCTLRTF